MEPVPVNLMEHQSQSLMENRIPNQQGLLHPEELVQVPVDRLLQESLPVWVWDHH